MSFRITGLHPEPFRHLLAAPDRELERLGARRVLVDAKPGAPCRVSLDDAEPGEAVILFSYEHQPEPTPYRQQGPIFIRAIDTCFDEVGVIPPAFARRPLSLRAFDASHMMIDADVVDGVEAETLIERLLDNAETAYIHAHYARRGCFAGTIWRA
jgi:hypothetical protein